ncbi:undecaprenyl/decaprenyl-phosphate alpha-N-acetylglucosaminyl 1-phosphate transferase [Listeria booriae]|uniref:Undecaprenyl/decaprenyl-phosphate alpha-N-acetylglucosaminyl 1-phosphate transferase n=2 Tax=Listeria booriae TaxID=1552123 RepID=A0A7X0XDA2_9LIST|nr:MraY family glycosyltransferase [Listeria booriae]MBC1335212.1 undecaprenyl/decaprenyl-phosphate alpha-N-acetylglucosaminyl 1-phosphate transferase [Listeria booriae]MBC1491591.1 undecaprenyl/decaprenyl-phosphate alpha-N-acetylglucosaminyl 1-phosphate transferase [Listeria booriae]MBC1511439.1 undecaprenyl/decaprenyl-phosphate alpha-N-acetylglucosaminyl 1-phosphate transferase [Listeria booriae]MBC1523386.1 undecaprenyl/decaprenyl-phosphate alpha-N-acetylglucosaminyl 1-phosphate transferase 
MQIWIMIICFLIGILLIPLVRKFAFFINAVDEPRERHIHKKITPTLGGLAIFLSFTVGMILLAVDKTEFLPVYIGALIIVTTGLIDDIIELSPRWKLVGQIAAALCVVLWGQITIEFINIPFMGPLYFGGWAIPITIIWIVAIVNALNLIDGLDGLAGGVAIIALLTIAGMALLLQDVFVAPVAFMLIACILAFLVYNFPPATIFMGDTGSLFLGYMIAVLSLMGFKNVTFISILVPLIILGVPLSDTFFAIIRRLKARTPISMADRSHIHHRLLALGFSERQTVLLIYCMAILFSITGFVFSFSTTWGAVILLLLLAFCIEIIVEFIGLIGENYRPILNILSKVRRKRK